ncbi:MAG: transposase [Acidobacteriota bacterium]|nr:transposase [Acidobacteriota bacterium]
MQTKDWPRAPVHRLSENGVYIVTAATLGKKKVFDTEEKLSFLESQILSLAKNYAWRLEAWAVFPNHYHFVVCAEEQAKPIRTLISHLHSKTAQWVNGLDGAKGRRVWFNFWDTRLTFQDSYLARLNYVHQNAIKHGLVKVASHYPWCSAAWFERTCSAAEVKTIYGFKIDKVNVVDDF